MSKCQNIVTYLHKSPKALEHLHECQQEVGQDKLGVIQDVDGRWSSTYFMLTRLLKIKLSLSKTLKTMQWRDLLLTDVEWEVVGDIQKALEPFSLLTVSLHTISCT